MCPGRRSNEEGTKRIKIDYHPIAIDELIDAARLTLTLTVNGMTAKDIIIRTVSGKADAQPEEYSTVEGTQEYLYLYGVFTIYPLQEGAALRQDRGGVRRGFQDKGKVSVHKG